MSEVAMNIHLFQTAQLLLSMYELRREAKMRAARRWFLSSFRPKDSADFFVLWPSGRRPKHTFEWSLAIGN